MQQQHTTASPACKDAYSADSFLSRFLSVSWLAGWLDAESLCQWLNAGVRA